MMRMDIGNGDRYLLLSVFYLKCIYDIDFYVWEYIVLFKIMCFYENCKVVLYAPNQKQINCTSNELLTFFGGGCNAYK